MSKPEYPSCAKCVTRICHPRGSANMQVNKEEAPDFCPMKLDKEALDKAAAEYRKEDVRRFAQQASIQEFECYEHVEGGVRTRFPRIEETIQFARKMGYKKLGLVFCGGLHNEAMALTKIFEKKGFEVVSACCKTGTVPKEELGLAPEQKIGGPDSYEPMCNPIAQAEIMNQEKPDWVMMVGLCVGHDTMFLKYCQRPVTCLAVKDRVTGHSPLAALYLSNSPYYGRLLAEEK